jgi:NAD-dependent histone deacetylase SIR2
LAGVSRVLQCHGSFATASCINCRRRVPGSEIENDIQSQKVPLCPVCNAASLKLAAKSLKKKGKGRKKDGWDSAESDESDEPNFPPGIMKVGRTLF